MPTSAGRRIGFRSRSGQHGSRRGGLALAQVTVMALLVAVSGCTAVPVLASGSLVGNYSFEQRLAADGTVPGWTPYANGAWMSLVREHATDGEWALKVNDVDAKQSVGMRSAPVPVTPGAQYAVLTDVHIASGTAMLYLEFWDGEGRRIESAVKTNSASGTEQDVQLFVENTAPPEAVAVTVLLYCSVPNLGVAYFDNVLLEKWD